MQPQAPQQAPQEQQPTATQTPPGMSGQQFGQLKEAYQMGVNIIYEESNSGDSRFIKIADVAAEPQGMAGVIVKVLQGIEGQMGGELDVTVLLAVGMSLIGVINDDMMNAGGSGLSPEQMQEAIATSVSMWLSQNGKRYPPEMMQQMMGGQGGGQPQQPAPQGLLSGGVQ